MKIVAIAATIAMIMTPAIAICDEAGIAESSSLAGMSGWTNQSGSTMSISVDPSGQVNGTYINRASGYGCQNTPYPVTGWIVGTSISFTVRWDNQYENCNSVTGWTGFYNTATGQIDTLWNLAVSGSTNPGQIISGSDTFSRTVKTESMSLTK